MFSYKENKSYKSYQKAQFEETEQASEPDMAEILELSGQEFKTTVFNMLRTLMDKVDSMQEHMGNVSREMEVLRKNQKINATDKKIKPL